MADKKKKFTYKCSECNADDVQLAIRSWKKEGKTNTHIITVCQYCALSVFIKETNKGNCCVIYAIEEGKDGLPKQLNINEYKDGSCTCKGNLRAFHQSLKDEYRYDLTCEQISILMIRLDDFIQEQLDDDKLGEEDDW